MQLFGLDGMPAHAAAMMCDTHVNSQVRETAQMCTTALRFVHGCNITGQIDCTDWPKGGIRDPYLNFSQHHPIVWWVAGSRAHFRWTLSHGRALAEEYKHRSGNKHMCEAFLDHLASWISEYGFPESMPETVTSAQWLKFVPESKREEWAMRIATEMPPHECEFGVVAIKDFQSSSPGNWVETYREYYKLKRVEWASKETRPITMTWSSEGMMGTKKKAKKRKLGDESAPVGVHDRAFRRELHLKNIESWRASVASAAETAEAVATEAA